MAEYIIEINNPTYTVTTLQDEVYEIGLQQNVYELIQTNSISQPEYFPVEDIFQLAGNQTLFNLTKTPRTNSVFFYVNGLKQRFSAFSVTNSTISVTDFIPTSGDTVIFEYQALAA
jgi:hypothetical protein